MSSNVPNYSQIPLLGTGATAGSVDSTTGRTNYTFSGGSGDGIPTLDGTGTNTVFLGTEGEPSILTTERQLNSAADVGVLFWDSGTLTSPTIGSVANWFSARLLGDNFDDGWKANYLTVTNLSVSGNISGLSGGGPKVRLAGTLGTDDTWSGTSITNLDAGETIAQWNLVRVHSDGQWHLADADAAGEFPATGIVSDGGDDEDPVNIVVMGTVRNDAWAWTVGGSIYLSDTAGGLTQTAPVGSGDAVQRVGFALSADSAFFNFSGEWGVNE